MANRKDVTIKLKVDANDAKSKLKSTSDELDKLGKSGSNSASGLSSAFDKSKSSLGGFAKSVSSAALSLSSIAGPASIAAAAIIAIGTAAVAVTAGLTKMATSSFNNITEIQKMATMAGVSTQAFQQLTFAASAYGIEQDTVTDGMKELALRGDEFVKTAAGPGAEAFKSLGYNTTTLNKALEDTPALFRDIVSKMQGLDAASQIRISDELLGGEAGEQFVALIQGGTKALDGLTQSAEDLGLVMDNQTIKKSAEAARQVKVLSTVLTNQKDILMAELAPAITKAVDGMLEWIKTNKDFINNTAAPALGEFGENVLIVAGRIGKLVEELAKLVKITNDAINTVRNFIGVMGYAINEMQDFVDKHGSSMGYIANKNSETVKQIQSEWGAVANITVAPKFSDDGLKSSHASAMKSSHSIKSPLMTGPQSLLSDKPKSNSRSSITPFVAPPKKQSTGGGESSEEKANKALKKAIDDKKKANDDYVSSLRVELATIGMTRSETELYKLALNGATKSQLDSASSLFKSIDAFKASAELKEQQKQKQNEIMQEGKSITEAMRTDLEVYNAEIAHLKELLDGGAISNVTFARAAADAKQTLEDTVDNSAVEEHLARIREVQDEVAHSFASGMTGALMDWSSGVASAKDAFLNFASSFLSQIAEMIIQAQMLALVQKAMGTSTGSSIMSSISTAVVGSAKGNVFSNGSIVPFATGGVVGSPTMFPMVGNKTGLMGEAGPEAIMPLQRLSSGKLGVAATGADSGGGSTTINVVNNFEGGDQGSEADRARMANQIRTAMIEVYKQEQSKDMRVGGSLYNYNRGY